MMPEVPLREILRSAHFVAALYPGAMDWMDLADLLVGELSSRVMTPSDDFSTPEKRSQTLVRWCGEIMDKWVSSREEHTYTTTEVRELLERGAYWRQGEDTQALVDFERGLSRCSSEVHVMLRYITVTPDDLGWGDVPEVIEKLTYHMNKKEEQ